MGQISIANLRQRQRFIWTNCLAYRYWYGPKFYNWLPVLLEKVKTTGTNKNFIIRYRYFSCCYLFVSLSDFSHISIYLSRDGLIFFCFLLYGTLGLLLCLNPKSIRGVAHFLLWWRINLSATCMHIFAIIFGWMVRSLDQRVHWRWYYQWKINK